MVVFIVIILLLLALFIFFKLYFEKFDTVVGYTGGLGSGKTLRAVQRVRKLLRRNRLKVKISNLKARIHNVFYKEKRQLNKDIPIVASNIPIFLKQTKYKVFNKHYNLVELKYNYYSKNGLDKYIKRDKVKELKISDIYIKRYIESSYELDEDILLCRKKLPMQSIVFIDEIGGFASQYEYANVNVRNGLDEFVRLYRHYTKGGYFVCTDQSSDNIVKCIRCRVNKVFNLMNFKKFLCFYKLAIREISLSEDIKTIEQNNSEENMKVTFGILPKKNTYDTYCYSVRYEKVPPMNLNTNFDRLKRYSLLKVSRDYKKPLTTNSKGDN